MMSGLETLAYALGATVALMTAVFVLSRILLRFGLLPLAAVFSLSGFNTTLATVIHELSHYLACLLTGVRVRQVRLFSPQKDGAMGWVLSDPSDPLRRSLIALAPFLGGSIAIYLLVRFGLPASHLDPLALAPQDLVEGFRAALIAIVDIIKAADLRRLPSRWGLPLRPATRTWRRWRCMDCLPWRW